MQSSSRSHLYGPNWQGQRCEARTRRGTPCQRPGNKISGRCKLHGGRSTGPRTEEGVARLAASQTTHGSTTKAERAKAKQRAEIKHTLGFMPINQVKASKKSFEQFLQILELGHIDIACAVLEELIEHHTQYEAD